MACRAATITHTLPRSLHSTHTLCVGVFGLRWCKKALMTSSSCCLLIGQPRNSKSTKTWAAIGVERSSVAM